MGVGVLQQGGPPSGGVRAPGRPRLDPGPGRPPPPPVADGGSRPVGGEGGEEPRVSRAGGREKGTPTIPAWGGGVEGGRSRQATEAEPRGPGKSWRARKEELRVSVVLGFRCVVLFFFFPRGGGRALTRESFDGLHRPVFVGAVHEGVAGFDQELAAVGDLVLRKHFLQVCGGHALVEVADVKLVHGGGGGAGRGPGQGRTGGRAGWRAESLLGREARRRAAGAANFLRAPPLKLSGAPGGWAT